MKGNILDTLEFSKTFNLSNVQYKQAIFIMG